MRTLNMFSVAAIAATLIATAHAQTNQGQAVVRELEGTADYTDGSGVWMPLRVGKRLDPGTTIRTAAGSSATLYLDQNGQWLQASELTTLGLDSMMYDRVGSEYVVETRLDLQAGRIFGQVRRTSSASKYEVKTPQTVVGLRGGAEYDISATGRTSIVSSQAVVVHTDPSGEVTTHLVPAGMTFDPETVSVIPTPQPPPIPDDWPPVVEEEVIPTFQAEPFVPATAHEESSNSQDGANNGTPTNGE